MPDRKTEKKFPYCEISVDGSCAAVNTGSWADYQRQQADEAFKQGKVDEANELLKAAKETEAGITYCEVCPFRVT